MHQQEQYEQQVFTLSVRDAKQQALLIISDPLRYYCSAVPVKIVDPALPPGLHQLFLKHDLISEMDGEGVLNGLEVEVYEFDRRFLKIGHDFDSVVLTVKPMEEPIYVFDGSETTPEDWTPAYPSIFHWVLIKNYILYGN